MKSRRLTLAPPPTRLFYCRPHLTCVYYNNKHTLVKYILVVLFQMPYHDCPATDVPSPLPCPSCPVLALIFWPSILCFLSWLYYPDCLLWLPSPGCLFPPVLSQLSCSIALVSCSPVPPVLSLLPLLICPGWPVWPTCPDWPVWAVQSSVVSDFMSQMSCPHFTIMAVLPQLSDLNCPVPPALFLLSCSGRHDLAILSSLYCLCCTIPTVFFSSCLAWLCRPICPAPAFLSPERCPPVLCLLCFHCPVLSVLSYMPCPRYTVMEILYRVSCPVCPGLSSHGWSKIEDKKRKTMKKFPFPETWR